MDTSPPLPTPDKPKLAWYENLWIAWPILLLFVGGALGGACGGAAWALNQQVFQKTKDPVLRYVWTGLISIAALGLYVVGVVIIFLIFKPHQ